jgi:hypothetical protein
MATDVKATDPNALGNLLSQMLAQPNPAGLPGAAAGKQPTANQLAQVWSLLGATALEGAPATADKSRGNKVTGTQKYAALGLPPVPRSRQTPESQAAYAAMNAQMQTALHTMAQSAQVSLHPSNLPKGAPAKPGMQITNPVKPNFDSATFASNTSAKAQSLLKGLDISHGNTLYAFMVLRLKHGQENLKQLQDLSQLSTDMQESSIKEQIAKSQEADKAAHKAHKKAGILGFLNKLVSVVMLIVTVVVVVASSFIGMTGAALIMAAMVVGFLVAGGVAGKKEHKGFDFWKGIDVAGYVGDAAMMLIGVGAILEALKNTFKESTRAAITAATKTAAENVGKSATESALKTGGKETLDAGAKALQERLVRVAEEQILKGTQKNILRGMMVREALRENFTQSLHKFGHLSAAKGSEKLAGKAAASAAASATEGVAAAGTAAAEGAAGAGAATGEAAAAAGGTAAKGADAMDSVTKGYLGTMRKLGDNAVLTSAGLTVASAAVELPQAIVKYKVARLQGDSDAAMAEVKMWKALYDVMDAGYKSAQDAIKHIVDSHGSAVKATHDMLDQKQRVSQMVLNNLAG